MRQRIKLRIEDQTIAEWTTGQPVENEQQFKNTWQLANDLAIALGYKAQEKSHKEAAFVQAFCGGCYYCGGTVKPDGQGGRICQDCGRYQ